LNKKEGAELQKIRNWFTEQQQKAMKQHIPEATVALERETSANTIKNERSRVVSFMANVRARFSRFKKAYRYGRITKNQLEKV